MNPEYLKRRHWLVDNPGVLRRTATEFKVSPSFVSDILHGNRNSKDRKIEKRLKQLKAPGFERY